MASSFLPQKKAYKIEELKTQTPVPGAKRIRIIYGPYKLGAANSTTKLGNGFSMDRGGTGYMHMVASDVPTDITVLQAHSELQNPDFTRVGTEQGIYNHHNVFMELTKPVDVYGCEPGVTPMAQAPINVLAAGATEDGFLSYYSEDGSIKSGFYLRKNSNVLNMVDVINYNNEEKEVYTATEVEYLDGKPEGYVVSSQQRVDPGICGGPSGASIHPPQGQSKFVIKSQNIVALKDGWIINARGHMHDGGVNLFLTVNDKVVCNSTAIYGGEGHTAKTADGKVWETINTSSYCNKTIPVKKGDKIVMQANYDVGLHPSREQGGGHGGMKGMAMRHVLDVLDGGDAEQMALMVTHFAVAE